MEETIRIEFNRPKVFGTFRLSLKQGINKGIATDVLVSDLRAIRDSINELLKNEGYRVETMK